ncbi:MAG: hypothetical protein MH321_03050 [Leptospiraceae bacterium]|nr:hypothetical protein [Leptospiraceae bacterium]
MDQNNKEEIIQFENGELEKAKKGFIENYDNYNGYNVFNLYLGKIYFYQEDFKKVLKYLNTYRILLILVNLQA